MSNINITVENAFKLLNKYHFYGAKEFGSLAFACGLDLVSRKSKCAKYEIAVYRNVKKVVIVVDCISNNGSSIEGVCVTGEAIRLMVPVVSKE